MRQTNLVPVARRPGNVGRSVKRALAMVAILALVMLALSVFAAWMIQARGAVDAVRSVHAWMTAIHPWAVMLQLATIGMLWRSWPRRVERAGFPPAVAAAWLAARHRLALWALGLVLLGVGLWATSN